MPKPYYYYLFKEAAVLAAFLIVLVIIGFSTSPLVEAAEEYVYYGVTPARIYRYSPKHILMAGFDITKGWKLDEGLVRKTALIGVAASEDQTELRVYTLHAESWSLNTEFRLDSMEKRFFTLPNGTVFKIVSNHPVFVLLMSGLGNDGVPGPETFEGPLPYAFYPSTSGSYIGKEFVFMASQGLSGEPYHIFALEKANVKLTREDGAELTFTLEPNSHIQFSLKAFTVYKAESTGNIMIQSGSPGGSSFLVPSAEGGFLGRRFYTTSEDRWDKVRDYDFVICALEDTKVKVWDLPYKKVLEELEVKAGEAVKMRPEPGGPEFVIAVESEKPITLAFIHSGNVFQTYGWSFGRGVTYLYVRPNEEVPFYLPTNSTSEVYIFAYEETQVRIDDVPVTVPADSYFLFKGSGTHRIQVDKNVVIQIIHWPLIPPTQGVDGFATTVPCIQAVNAAPKTKLTPIAGGGGFPSTYIIAGAATAALAAAGVIALKRRGRQATGLPSEVGIGEGTGSA
jgi:hypothetical protein